MIHTVCMCVCVCVCERERVALQKINGNWWMNTLFMLLHWSLYLIIDYIHIYVHAIYFSESVPRSKKKDVSKICNCNGPGKVAQPQKKYWVGNGTVKKQMETHCLCMYLSCICRCHRVDGIIVCQTFACVFCFNLLYYYYSSYIALFSALE